MMKYGIEEYAVHGVKNPRLILKGWIQLDNFKLLLEHNGEVFREINCHEASFINGYNFLIDTPIKGFQKLELIAVKGKKRYLLKEINTSFNKRLFKRLISKFGDLKIKNIDRLFYYDPINISHYNKWLSKNEKATHEKKHEYNPLISIVIPVYNVKRNYLVDCLNSIINQKYKNFEVCLADDHSTNEETLATLKEYEKKDKRIKVIYREQNGHISEATNTALTIAKGEFVALMDNDDMLLDNSLNEIVHVLNENRELDFIYTDEDKIDLNGRRCDPHFKPDFQIDSFYGGNYVCHFSVIRKTVIDKIGGFRKGYEGAQDFDLFLRISEVTDKVYHLPKVLYHWRMIPGSTALASESKNYAGNAGKKALEDYFNNKKIKVNVDIIVNTHYFVEYILENNPLVSIIIKSNNNLNSLRRCLNSILKVTTYKNYEIIIADVSDNDETEKFIKDFHFKKMKIVKMEKDIDKATAYNALAGIASGEYLLFLDVNSKIKTFNWIELMVGYASQKEIGCVGVKILNDNKTIKDGGIILDKEKIFLKPFIGRSCYDYGTYGRLLVPFNYKAVETSCMMIKKEKFTKVNGFDEKLDYDYSSIDLCLKVNQNNRNIFLPEVEVINYRKKARTKFENSHDIVKNRWNKELSYDEGYNQNLSNKYPFKLDRK